MNDGDTAEDEARVHHEPEATGTLNQPLHSASPGLQSCPPCA